MFNFRLTIASWLLTVLAMSASALADDKPRAEQWMPLFNGKDLSGWTPKISGFELGDNFGDTFRVEDGVLKVSYDKYESFNGKSGKPMFGHLFYETPYSNYRLRVEYRFVGDQAPAGPGWAIRNSGVMVHGQAPETMTKDQDFPVSIEVQLLGGTGSGERTTANLCTPGTNVVMNGELITRHCTSSQSKTYAGDQWVRAEIEVRGNKIIKHLVEGEPVLEYSEPQLDERDANAQKLLQAGAPKMLEGGSISLQSESHPVEFRKVELLRLEE